jgi:hypothetical protein
MPSSMKAFRLRYFGMAPATRELQRLHGKAVRGEHDLVAIQCQRHGIGLYIEFRVAEVARKDFINQLAHETAAVAVRQCYMGVFHHVSEASYYRRVRRAHHNTTI